MTAPLGGHQRRGTRHPRQCPLPARTRGFTLLELIIVIALIGITLGVTLPRFRASLLSRSGSDFTRWIRANVPALKNRAYSEQRGYDLHIDMDQGRAWVTARSASEEEIEDAAPNGFQLDPDARFIDVETADGSIASGTARIGFYGEGYSDKAVIHLEDEQGDQFSFMIEPFLPKVKRYGTYVGLNG